jgi:Metal binding domain of Ada
MRPRTARQALWGLVLVLGLALGAALALAADQPGAVVLAAAKEHAPAAEIVYHGNVRSKKFHRPGCRYYNCRNCTAHFASRAQAIAAGYVPCKVCRP